MNSCKVILFAIVSSILTACSWRSMEQQPLQTVPYLDINHFLGQWYEIASIPIFFQAHCVCTRSYFERKDDHFEATNICRDSSPHGEIDEANAEAWIAPGSHNAKFEVQFIWPLKNDYWIIYLDQDYRHAIAATPDRKYLWILSRSPHVTEAQYQLLVEKASERGFNLNYLKRIPQSCKTMPTKSSKK